METKQNQNSKKRNERVKMCKKLNPLFIFELIILYLKSVIFFVQQFCMYDSVNLSLVFSSFYN